MAAHPMMMTDRPPAWPPDAVQVGPTKPPSVAAAVPIVRDQPGRWLGGAVGALVSLAAAAIGGQFESTDIGALSISSWGTIGLLGIPIAFVLGRQLFPLARSAGWGTALMTGMLVGIAAPPLGAIEILGGSGLIAGSAGTSSTFGGLEVLVLLPFALPFSYVAAVMTIPVGLVWAILVRALPDSLPSRLRAPDWLARVGARHVLAFIVALAIVVEVARAVAAG